MLPKLLQSNCKQILKQAECRSKLEIIFANINLTFRVGKFKSIHHAELNSISKQ